MYLVEYVFVVSNVVLKGNNRFPGVILSKHAATGDFAVFMESHSQRITADQKQKIFFSKTLNKQQ